MRLIGLVLALGAIAWVLLQASGGGDSQTVVPESYQQSLNKAESVEQSVQQATLKRMQEMEDANRQVDR